MTLVRILFLGLGIVSLSLCGKPSQAQEELTNTSEQPVEALVQPEILVPTAVQQNTPDKLQAESPMPTQTQEAMNDGWLVISGNTINFYYLPDANLKKLEARLRSRDVPMALTHRSLLANKSLTIEEKIALRLEIILLRVKTILGMNPRDMKVKVEVFKNRGKLNEEYERMFKTKVSFKSFYVHSFETVFTSEQDFLDSILAHELGHAVIDHYFSVPPPTAMAELMATYVDTHLDKT